MMSRVLFILPAIFVIGIALTPNAKAQESSTWGSTSISYDLDSDTLTGTATVDPDYLAADFYDGQVTAHIRDANMNILASGTGLYSITLQYTGTTDGMEYLMQGSDYMVMYVQDDNPGPHFGFYEDYYDYDVYAFEGIDSEDTYEFEGPGPLVENRTNLINLGETYSQTVVRKPDHLLIGNDLIGNQTQCGGAIRELDYVVHATNHQVVSAGEYFEDMSATDSCFNQTVATTSSCTSFTGGFMDILKTGCGNGTTPPANHNCGFDSVDHWKWCNGQTPPTLATMNYSVHYNLVTVNNNTGTPHTLEGTDPAPK